MVLLAHLGKIDADGAKTFAVMMLVLGCFLAAIYVFVRVRQKVRPYLGGLIAGLPFWVLAFWCMVYVAACRAGADRQSAWWIVIVGTPASMWIIVRVLRSTNFLPKPDQSENSEL